MSELRQTCETTNQDLAGLKDQLMRVEEQYSKRPSPAVDPSDTTEAHIHSIETRVEEPPEAA